MKKTKSFVMWSIVGLMGTTMFTACSSGNDVEDSPSNVVYDQNGKEGVKPEFVISLPRNVVG